MAARLAALLQKRLVKTPALLAAVAQQAHLACQFRQMHF
jgi:hypothetical protein